MSNQKLGSDRDPVGSIFLEDGRVLRGIHAGFEDAFTSVLNNPAVQSLIGAKIVETRTLPAALPGYALTLEHRRITPASYAYEWPLQMLQDAALLTLDLCIELSSAGLTLKDASPWNILYDGPKPLLVDFTSIMPVEKNFVWTAYDQFCRLFLFPLLIGQHFDGGLSRALLLRSGGGVSPEEAARFLPRGAWLKHGWLVKRLYFPKMMVDMLRRSGQDKELARRVQAREVPPAERESFFTGLRKDVASLQFAAGQSRWSQYYDDIDAFFQPDQFHQKQKVVAKILAHTRPETVVDIGCNQGGYSILAAQSGARVVAFDSDEDSVTLLYRLAKLKELDILPLTGDVLYPAPQAGWRAQEFPAAPARFHSQMALALALVHHLAITQIQTFPRIVTTLSEYAGRWLLTEFVPLEDPRSQELLVTNQRDMSWYTLEGFVDALKAEFPQVETFPSHPSGRTLCLCTR